MSETAKHRHRFAEYTQGMGVDVGYGGDPITESSITMDLDKSVRYGNVGTKPQNLWGHAENLYWFRDSALDYLFSSHLIEDFEDTTSVLSEWRRVICWGGFMCLLFPDEKRYRSIETEQNWNQSHKHMDMGLEYMVNIISQIPHLTIIEAKELFDDNDYNCMIVCRKDWNGTI